MNVSSLCTFSNTYCPNRLCLSQGEKYLVLKKKYRQMLQDRDARLHGTDGDDQRGSSPARAPAAAQWDASDASTSSHQQKDQQDEPMLCGEQDEAAEVTLKPASILLYL